MWLSMVNRVAATDGPALPQVIPCTDFDSYMYTIDGFLDA